MSVALTECKGSVNNGDSVFVYAVIELQWNLSNLDTIGTQSMHAAVRTL